MKEICVLGNDNRSIFLKKMYLEEGKELLNYIDAKMIIAPIPFTKDNININNEDIIIDDLIEKCKNQSKTIYTGLVSEIIREKFEKNKINIVDLMKLDEIAILNAIPTAEGAIYEAIKNTNFTIHSSNILITGYGRIGKVLANMLKGFGANIFCEARNKKDIALIDAMGYNSIKLDDLDKYISNMNIIFNTIPCVILNQKRLDMLNKDCVIIDLASQPGGIDFQKAKELGINVIWALALPSKIAPCSAAKYLKYAIDEFENDNK
ncbi:MAG: dipicolinate synthase subunit DpsA [Clostridia bacterium]